MSAITKHGTTLIVLLNTFFGLIGLVLLVAGFLVKYATDLLDKYGTKLISTFKDKVPEQIGDKLENFKISEFVGGASTAFIIVGVTLLALVIWAYCGTCCQSKWMLIVYAALLTAIILGEVALAVLFATNRSMIDEKIKKPLKESLDLYEGSTSNSAISLGWNALMGLLKCCGVDGPKDFENVTTWNHLLDPSQFPGHTQIHPTMPITLDAPIVCAVDKESAIQKAFHGSTVQYIQTGCYEAIWAQIEKHKAIVIGITAGLGAFQIILWVVTVCIIRELGKSGRNKVSAMKD